VVELKEGAAVLWVHWNRTEEGLAAVLTLDTGGLHGWQRMDLCAGVSGLKRLYGWPGGEARLHPLDA
jgi:hypothetical protein